MYCLNVSLTSQFVTIQKSSMTTHLICVSNKGLEIKVLVLKLIFHWLVVSSESKYLLYVFPRKSL